MQLYFTGLSTSSTGMVVAACTDGGAIYLSRDYGTTFIEVALTAFWTGITMNSKGQYLAATDSEGTIYVSTDSGLRWNIVHAPDYPWACISMSSSGQHIAAAFEGQNAIFLSPDYGVSWTQYANNASDFVWSAVTGDNSGQLLTATVYGGLIFVSSNFGATWTVSSAPYGFWSAVACDSVALHRVAVMNYGEVYVSESSGATWSVVPLRAGAWSGVAMDGSGQNIAACLSNGGIWISSDYGSSWRNASAPDAAWTSISLSASAGYATAVQSEGYVYFSTDYGSSWIATNDYNSGWVSVSVDANGKDAVAASSGGLIYFSSDFSQTWSQITTPGYFQWASVALNSSGELIFACSSDGGVWLSFNKGTTWNLTSLPFTVPWAAVATNAEGNHIVALASGMYGQGGIFVSTSYGVRWTESEVQTVNSPTYSPTQSPSDEDSAQNKGGSVFLGVICLVISLLLLWIYLCLGRLQQVALQRKLNLIRPALRISALTINSLDLAASQQRFTHASKLTRSLKSLAFVFLSLLIVFVSILGAFVFGITHVLFNALIIFRAYKQSASLSANHFKDAVKQLCDAFALDGVTHSFKVMAGGFADAAIELNNVEAACSGAQAPQYLLLYLLIAGVVLIQVRAETQIFWKLGLEPVLMKVWSYMGFLHRGRGLFSSLAALLMGFIIYIAPSPRKLMQFALTFVDIFRFFAHEGRSKSNGDCSALDPILAVLTSILMYLLLAPFIFLLAHTVSPCSSPLNSSKQLCDVSTVTASASTAQAMSEAVSGAASESDYQQYKEKDGGVNVGGAAVCAYPLQPLAVVSSADWLLVKTASAYTEFAQVDVKDEARVTKIAWLGMLQRSREDSHNLSPTFASLAVQTQTSLSSSSPSSLSTRFFIRPLSYLIVTQLISAEARQSWLRAWKNLRDLVLIGLGVWTSQLSSEHRVIEHFEETQNLLTSEDKAFQSDALSTALRDPTLRFQRFLFALTAPRLLLLQLIPVFTLPTVFFVELARCPLFVTCDKMQALLPPLVEVRAFALARELLCDETATPSTWKVLALGLHLLFLRSRLLNFLLVFVLNVTAVGIVFFGTQLDPLYAIITVALVLAGFAQAMHFVLLLHRALFPAFVIDRQTPLPFPEDVKGVNPLHTSSQTPALAYTPPSTV